MQNRILIILAALLSTIVSIGASKGPWERYPGGKHYIWRYTLKDKQGSAYSLSHPTRWLSHKSVERRKRQGLAIDSTDLPVSEKYLKQIERTAENAMKGHRHGEAGWHLIGTSRWNNTVIVEASDTLLLRRLSQLDCVVRSEQVWISPDSIQRSIKTKVHTDFNPWDSVRGAAYGHGREQIEMLHGQRLHAIGLRGRGKTIAVLDGGFQNCDVIPAITQANITETKDFVFPSSLHFYQETDHGTKVLSAMAANVPEVLVGTAPEARYLLLRCEDQQTEQPVEEDYWAMAAEYADSAGVDIISSSLGYNIYDGYPGYYHQRDLNGQKALISRTASLLAAKGIVLVNSAGNSGMSPWKKITFPADAHQMLTVGALDTEQHNAPFSGVGPTQDGRVKPDVMALGSPVALISGRGTVVRDMGTSFATPIVSGLVACLWQALPKKTALEIINLVRRTASNQQEPDNIFGFGIPNFWRAYMIGKLEAKTVQ